VLLASAARDVLEHYRERGLQPTARLCVLKLREVWFDFAHGVKTKGIISLDRLTMVGESRPDCYWYVATALAVVEEAMDALGRLRIPWQRTVFVDLGSGKGRVLLCAARLPFKAILGVEFSNDLHDQALRNVASFRRSHRSPPIECLRQDAATFQYPDEDLVIFMFNPFGTPVLQPVLDNLRCFVNNTKRSVHIVYVYPRSWIQPGGASLLTELLTPMDFLDCVYRSVSDDCLLLDSELEIWESRAAG
jgi:predicted RNA methylase